MNQSPACTADAMTTHLRKNVELEMTKGATKRDALRVALVSAINSGKLKPGTRLQPETSMAQDLSLSLGTVQAALRQIQDLGLIERRRGDGTTVSKGPGFASAVWHFRMHMIETGEPFRIKNVEIEILQSTESGRWTVHLGDLPEYLVIRRRVEGDGVQIGAEMFLDPALVPPSAITAGELRLTNLRKVLEQKLKIRAGTVKHTVRYDDVVPRKLASFGLDLDQKTLTVEARTRLTDNRPFYFQTIYIPARKIALEF